MTREEELKKEGWEKRTTTDESRLSEMVNEYEQLGFEVLIEPLDLKSEGCAKCFNISPANYKTIYIRRRRS